MSRPNLRRILAASTSAALVALALLAAPVSAGNTRDLLFGSPTTPPDPFVNWTVTYLPTSPGGYTITSILIKNNGSQTLNHASLYGGYAADHAVENPLFAKPQDTNGDTLPSLPVGLTYAAVYAPTGLSCAIEPDPDTTPPTPNRSLSCDLGQLESGASVTISVIVKTSGTPTDPLATPSWDTWYGLYLSETNSTGSNQDNFYARGSISTTAVTCDTNTAASYFLADKNVSLATADCKSTTDPLAQVKSGLNVGGQGGYGVLSSGASISTDCTKAGYTCYGNGIEATILGGTPVPGGLEWTVRWYGIKSLKGVIHILDDGTLAPPIWFKKAYECSTPGQSNCWISTSSSSGSADPWWFQATFVTPDNGRIGGFI